MAGVTIYECGYLILKARSFVSARQRMTDSDRGRGRGTARSRSRDRVQDRDSDNDSARVIANEPETETETEIEKRGGGREGASEREREGERWTESERDIKEQVEAQMFCVRVLTHGTTSIYEGSCTAQILVIKFAYLT